MIAVVVIVVSEAVLEVLFLCDLSMCMSICASFCLSVMFP